MGNYRDLNFKIGSLSRDYPRDMSFSEPQEYVLKVNDLKVKVELAISAKYVQFHPKIYVNPISFCQYQHLPCLW